MASRAPHPLAEAICELAAPWLAPTYCKIIVLREDGVDWLALVLHVRPRAHAAGLEIAVHAGKATSSDDMGGECTVNVAAPLYAVP
jgi:hypothetical protein